MIPKPEGQGWRTSPGKQPNGLKRKRIEVVLANGMRSKPASGPAAPSHWLADTTRWDLTDSPFDVAWWRRI